MNGRASPPSPLTIPQPRTSPPSTPTIMVDQTRERDTVVDPTILKKERARGTAIDANVLSKEGTGSRARGTTLDRSILDGSTKASVPEGGHVDEAGKPISSEDRVQTHVTFNRRISSVRQIKSPPSGGEPKSAALKMFNRGSICLDSRKLRRKEYVHSEDAKEEFQYDYGLTEVMMHKVLDVCSKTHAMKVFLDNGLSMKKEDGVYIIGERKESADVMTWALPEDKRFAHNSEAFDLSTESCPRYIELQDVSYFLLNVATTLQVPISFELLNCSRKVGGRGRGYRKVEKPQGTTLAGVTVSGQSTNCNSADATDGTKKEEMVLEASDYIPYGDQVESALELIEGYSTSIDSGNCSCLQSIEGLKKSHGKDFLGMKKEGKRIVCTFVLSLYPWGRKGDIGDIPLFTANFIDLLNGFANLPVAFVFIVEAREEKIIQFYDKLVSPESGVTADVKVAKGLGLMIKGVYKFNPWLNHCLPIHLCQVLGICGNLLSLAASRPLGESEVRELCNELIGNVSDPSEDLEKFIDKVNVLMSDAKYTKWDPSTCKDGPMIDAVKLRKHLSKMPGLLVAILVCLLAMILGHLSRYTK